MDTAFNQSAPVGLSVESVLDDHVIMHDVVNELVCMYVVILSNTRSS
jgi:hypothetical protein